MGYGSYSAAVAEVSVSPEGKLKVHRMVLALDCGHVVNPGQIAAQVEGSVAYGLTATLYGECRVDRGRMVDVNFDTYEIMRLAEMPKVETVIVPTLRLLGRRRRADHLRRGAGGAQRHPRCNRQARAQPAAQERAAGVIARLRGRPASCFETRARKRVRAPQHDVGGAVQLFALILRSIAALRAAMRLEG